MFFTSKKNAYSTPEMAGPKEVSAIAVVAVLLGFACFLIFWSNPTLDKEALHLFWSENGRFFLKDHSGIGHLRQAMFISIALFYGLVGIGWVIAFTKQSSWFGLTWDKWCYLGVCGIVGPALWVNGVLKAFWGRGRPRDVEEFGGLLNYTDFWVWSDQCIKNCSFTSGEVAAVAMILFSMAFVSKFPRRQMFFAFGIFASLVTAWMRMTAGAHFLSDTLMSIVFMLLLASIVYGLFFFQDGAWIAKANAKQVSKIQDKQR